MASTEDPRDPPKIDQEPLLSRILNTAKEYASGTTIHGLSYIANSEHHLAGRIFWVVVVILALSLTTFQMLSLLNQWETSPVITNLETIALPIEKIKFPAVTICPQGSVEEVMDNVLFQQFTEYLNNKNQTNRSKRSPFQDTDSQLEQNTRDLWNVTYEEMLGQIEDFMRDVYPGALDNPRKFVTLMTSDNPHQVVKNEAVILPVQDEECDETSNRDIVTTLNKHLNHDFCPDGFTKFGNMGCVLVAESEMNYNEASAYCKDMYGASVLPLVSYDDIKTLNEQNIIGTYYTYYINDIYTHVNIHIKFNVNFIDH